MPPSSRPAPQLTDQACKPSALIRTSSASSGTSTRSANSWTIRACSAGNNSFQTVAKSASRTVTSRSVISSSSLASPPPRSGQPAPVRPAVSGRGRAPRPRRPRRARSSPGSCRSRPRSPRGSRSSGRSGRAGGCGSATSAGRSGRRSGPSGAQASARGSEFSREQGACPVLLPDGKDQFLVPPVGILRETGTLYPYDAEALAGGRLHHHPALQVVHHLGA